VQPHAQGKTNKQRATPYPSLTVEEFTHVADNIDLFRAGCDWIRSYLAQPHPQLGRAGNVCPFVAPALAKDSLRIAVVRLSSIGDKRTQIVNAVKLHCNAFLSLVTPGETHILHATLVLFPDVSSEEAPDLIDCTKEELKASFIEQGLMLGEFHPRNESPGLHNPTFMPLRSPVPMLVIRRMVATDFVFLDRSEYDNVTRLRYLETYLRVSCIPDSTSRKEVERTAASLRAELKNSTSQDRDPLESSEVTYRERQHPNHPTPIKCPHTGFSH